MNRRLLATMGVAAAFVGLTAGPALAEGDETLGPASVTVASGTGLANGGTGLFNDGAGTITVEVPAGATVKQVLLYWDGQTSEGNAPDNVAVVEGTDVTGTALSSAPIPFFTQSNVQVYASGYRADITSLDLVGPGTNTIDISGLNFLRNGKNITNGAGVLVVYDDGSEQHEISLLDGVDTAFFEFPSPRDTTVPQTFTFAAADVERTATFHAFASSVYDGSTRPNALKVTIDGVETVIENPFKSADGSEYDTYETPITIPAGATSVTIQALSVDENPDEDPLGASLTWTIGALDVPPAPTPPTTAPPTTAPPTTLPPTSVTTTPQVEETTTTLPPSTTTVPPTTSTTVSQTELPKTGNDTLPLVFAGLGLVLVGGAAVLGVRRFRSAA